MPCDICPHRVMGMNSRSDARCLSGLKQMDLAERVPAARRVGGRGGREELGATMQGYPE